MPPTEENDVVAVVKFAIALILKREPGVELAIPKLPFVSIVSTGVVEVANVEGEEVARYRAFEIVRRVQMLEVSDASVSASCAAVEEESVISQRGVVVPTPTLEPLNTSVVPDVILLPSK